MTQERSRSGGGFALAHRPETIPDMAHPTTTNEQNESGAATPPPVARVTVRYWAAARAAAGVSEEMQVGRNVAEVLAGAVRSRPGDQRFARVLQSSSILVGEAPVGTRPLEAVPLKSGDVLEILPPFAGGSADTGFPFR